MNNPFKNFSLIFLEGMFLFFTININLLTAHTLQTPRGSYVEHDHPSDSGWYGYQYGIYGYYTAEQWTSWSDAYYDGLYIQRLERANKAYNCHAYAWAGARQSNSSTWCWIGNDPSCTDENIYWTDGSYDEVSQSIATHTNYGDIKDHSLLVYGGNTMTSKWRKLPLYKHQLYSDPYGAGPNDTKFYRRSVDVPQDYSTIQAALGAAVPGQTVIVSAGTYTENNNLTVTSSITLQLNPGGTLKMANGKKLTINGTLSAQGTAGNRITFQSISGTWYGIEINYGGYRPFNYCIIKNATCGIRAYQTSNLYVENCEITTNTNGITFDNQSSGYVRYSKINSNSGNSGINCSQNSNPIIRSYNQIKYNAPAGLYGDYNSLPELGNWGQYGNNSISNSYDDVWSENSNSVYALYNYWGSSSPDPNVSDNVVWQPYLTSDPTGGGLLKPLADNVSFVLANTAADTTGKSEFAGAYLVYLSGDYATALVLFKELVTKYPETAAGLQALALTDYCHQTLDNASAPLSYLDQVGDSFAGKEISGLAQSIAVGHLVKLGNYQEAITRSDQILQAFPDKDLAKYALYDLGTIYWFF